MDNIQRRLEEARAALRNAQGDLACFRKGRMPTLWIRNAERAVCFAIDRAWEAQCMAQGSL